MNGPPSIGAGRDRLRVWAAGYPALWGV